jgi:hypothetical protein
MGRSGPARGGLSWPVGGYRNRPPVSPATQRSGDRARREWPGTARELDDIQIGADVAALEADGPEAS